MGHSRWSSVPGKGRGNEVGTNLSLSGYFHMQAPLLAGWMTLKHRFNGWSESGWVNVPGLVANDPWFVFFH